MLFIASGIVEVYTLFEGNEFLIEKLHKGTIINYRTFLMEDRMFVNMRCKTNCTILEHTFEDFKDLLESVPLIK